jgi:hypothetical protein
MIKYEIKSRLNWDNAFYHSVYKLLSPRLWSKNVKIKICKTIVLPVVLYEFKLDPLHYGKNTE